MDGDEYHNAKQNIDVNEMMKMKTLRGMDDNFTSTKASKQQHDDVDVVLLNLGLPLSIVSNAKNLVENDNYRLKIWQIMTGQIAIHLIRVVDY